MRGAFAKTVTELAARDPRVLLLTADLGYMALEVFSDKFPERFINVGVAEQNMVGVATGLADAGFIPFLYSIVTFAALRPYEFIRNGPILHQFPVRIAGVGGGFEYGPAGPTHHGLEDVGVMRVQPGITVIAPADYAQTCTAIHATWDLPGPVYYRLGKDDKAVVPGLDGRFELGRAQIIRDGGDLLLIAMGGITPEVAAAADALETRGIRCTVAVVASLNPAPVDDLAALLARFPVALTVEAHYVVGGIGSLVAEVAAEHGLSCRVMRCGVRTTPDGVTGSQQYLQESHGLSREALVETALRVMVGG
ncbi:MAG: 1-deoxy-D-xylulose-5-phosphate synthase [Anaerolineae bacterium]|nr:1-deoxy-D-xylulose-5-phosphate synthase [Anaerolineae bacterium]